MKGFSSVSMGIIIAVIIGLLIIISVLGLGQTAQGVQTSVTQFFELFGKITDYLGQRVFLASEQTRDIFCTKELKDAQAVCNIETEELKSYCSAEDKEALCQNPTETMKEFCREDAAKKDKACQNQRGFFNFCENLDKLAAAENLLPGAALKNLVLCK